MHRLSLFARAKYILQTEGLITLLKRGFAFRAGCFFRYATFYVYEHRMDGRSEADFMPRIRDFTLKIVSTNQQADELVADGFEPLSQGGIHRERLKRGAIAFCMFVERELCHISWVAMSKQAKDIGTVVPFPVDFSNNEAYLGWTAKNPKHLRISHGFSVYVYFQVMQFLRQRGITVCRFRVRKRNTIAQNSLAKKMGILPYGEGLYLKLFLWKIWREKPLTPGHNMQWLPRHSN